MELVVIYIYIYIYIYMHINVVLYLLILQLYLRHKFYNIVFKIKHNERFGVRACIIFVCYLHTSGFSLVAVVFV